MKLFVSFSARDTGNCSKIIDFLKAPRDKVICYKDLKTHRCGSCDYECMSTRCKYRDDDVYGLYESLLEYEKVILLVPMYCGNPSSLYFSFNERGQDFFMRRERDYLSIAEKLFIIGVYGSKDESPGFIGCLGQWFEGTPFYGHVLGIERHLYNQKMNDSVLDIPVVRDALTRFAGDSHEKDGQAR